jgi:hypothetical protein
MPLREVERAEQIARLSVPRINRGGLLEGQPRILLLPEQIIERANACKQVRQ